MTEPDEIKTELVKVLGQKMPSVEVVRIESAPMTDSDGQESIAITVVTRQHPARTEAPHLIEVIDDFRTWLVSHPDRRFPYVRLLTEDEAREVLH